MTRAAMTRAAMTRAAVARRPRFGAVAWHVVLLAVVVAALFPLAWATITSLRRPDDLFSVSPLPWPISLEHYREALFDFPIATMLLNTAITAVGVTVLQILVAIPAAYAVVRFRPRWASALLLLVGAALIIPPQAVIIPQFFLAAGFGWRNSYAGLIVPQLASCALPILLFREHLANIPPTLVDASVMDGARPWETLRFVVLPLLRPAIGAVSILVFITTWNEYLWPTLVAPRADRTTIQTGLQLFANQEGPTSGALLAAAVVTTVPVVVVYALASRHIANAFLQSGIK